MACSRVSPHISRLGGSEPHTLGRSGRPNSRQRKASSRCGQGMPAGLPFGRPGMGLLMDGAMQQAAQPGRQARVGAGDAGMAPIVSGSSQAGRYTLPPT